MKYTEKDRPRTSHFMENSIELDLLDLYEKWDSDSVDEAAQFVNTAVRDSYAALLAEMTKDRLQLEMNYTDVGVQVNKKIDGEWQANGYSFWDTPVLAA